MDQIRMEVELMNCTNCGNTINEGSTFCTECGTAVTATEAQAPVHAEPSAQTYTQPQPTPNYYAQPEITEDQLPEKFKPMGAWSYFGHQLLFSIPVVGLILLIVFAVGGTENINKRNFARSYFCTLLLGAIIGIIVLVLAIVLGMGVFATQSVADVMYY